MSPRLRRAVTAGDSIAAVLGEEFRHAHPQSLAQLLELVEAQGQPVVLDLREGRERNSALRAHLFERPAFAMTQSPEQGSEGGTGTFLFHGRQFSESVESVFRLG